MKIGHYLLIGSTLLCLSARAQARLEVSRTVIPIGQSATVTVSITNSTNATMVFKGGEAKGYELMIRDEQGVLQREAQSGSDQAAPSKQTGQPEAGPNFMLPGVQTASPAFFLEPGKTFTNTEPLLAGKQLAKPGTYTLQLKVLQPGLEKMMLSNVVKFTVTKE